MRIIGGKFRGKILQSPEGLNTRPTSDRARESAFNLVAHRYRDQGWKLDGARVIDAFAGTGAMGLEALSRGASDIIFFENDRETLKVLTANVRTMKADQQTRIITSDATNPPRNSQPASIAFFDPPYGKGLAAPALIALSDWGWLAEGALCVVELEAKEDIEIPDRFEVLDERKYGKAKFVFLKF